MSTVFAVLSVDKKLSFAIFSAEILLSYIDLFLKLRITLEDSEECTLITGKGY